MGTLDKFINFMKVNTDEDDDYEYEDEYLDDEEEEIAPKRRTFAKKEDDEEERPAIKNTLNSKVLQMKRPAANRANNTGSGMEVCVIKPTSVDEEREITETLLANRTVILNLEGLDMDIAQRITDFVSGSCYAIQGNLQKISQYILIITPPNVDISGDFQEIFGNSFDMTFNH